MGSTRCLLLALLLPAISTHAKKVPIATDESNHIKGNCDPDQGFSSFSTSYVDGNSDGYPERPDELLHSQRTVGWAEEDEHLKYGKHGFEEKSDKSTMGQKVYRAFQDSSDFDSHRWNDEILSVDRSPYAGKFYDTWKPSVYEDGAEKIEEFMKEHHIVHSVKNKAKPLAENYWIRTDFPSLVKIGGNNNFENFPPVQIFNKQLDSKSNIAKNSEFSKDFSVELNKDSVVDLRQWPQNEVLLLHHGKTDDAHEYNSSEVRSLHPGHAGNIISVYKALRKAYLDELQEKFLIDDESSSLAHFTEGRISLPHSEDWNHQIKYNKEFIGAEFLDVEKSDVLSNAETIIARGRSDYKQPVRDDSKLRSAWKYNTLDGVTTAGKYKSHDAHESGTPWIGIPAVPQDNHDSKSSSFFDQNRLNKYQDSQWEHGVDESNNVLTGMINQPIYSGHEENKGNSLPLWKAKSPHDEYIIVSDYLTPDDVEENGMHDVKYKFWNHYPDYSEHTLSVPRKHDIHHNGYFRSPDEAPLTPHVFAEEVVQYSEPIVPISHQVLASGSKITQEDHKTDVDVLAAEEIEILQHIDAALEEEMRYYKPSLEVTNDGIYIAPKNIRKYHEGEGKSRNSLNGYDGSPFDRESWYGLSANQENRENSAAHDNSRNHNYEFKSSKSSGWKEGKLWHPLPGTESLWHSVKPKVSHASDSEHNSDYFKSRDEDGEIRLPFYWPLKKGSSAVNLEQNGEEISSWERGLEGGFEQPEQNESGGWMVRENSLRPREKLSDFCHSEHHSGSLETEEDSSSEEDQTYDLSSPESGEMNGIEQLIQMVVRPIKTVAGYVATRWLERRAQREKESKRAPGEAAPSWCPGRPSRRRPWKARRGGLLDKEARARIRGKLMGLLGRLLFSTSGGSRPTVEIKMD